MKTLLFDCPFSLLPFLSACLPVRAWAVMSRRLEQGEFVQHHCIDWTSLAGNKNSWTHHHLLELKIFYSLPFEVHVQRPVWHGTSHLCGVRLPFSPWSGLKFPSLTSKVFQRVWNFPCRREICFFPRHALFKSAVPFVKVVQNMGWD